MISLKKLFIGWIAPKQPVLREIFYLKRAIKKNDRIIYSIWSLPQPVCCHYCGYPELYDMEEEQERRRKRLKELEKYDDR